MNPEEPRTCGECSFYDSATAKCLVYCSVSQDKRKSYKERVSTDQECRYALGSNENIALSQQGILRILNRAPLTFWEEAFESDIDLKILARN